MNILSDKILAGALIGIFANGVKLTFNYLGYFLGWTDVVFWQIVASRFLAKEDLFTPYAYLVGGIADIVMTASIGIIFLYALEFFGKGNLWLRGSGMGLLLWVTLFGTLLGQSVENKIPQEPSGLLVTLGAHFIYGIAVAFFAGLYYKIMEKQGETDQLAHSFVAQPARKVQVFRIKKPDPESAEQTKKFIKPRKI